MSRRKILRAILVIACAFILNLTIFKCVTVEGNKELKLSLTINAENIENYQIFFSEDGAWSEELSSKMLYDTPKADRKLNFNIPLSTNYIRVDFGENPSYNLIKDMYFTYWGKSYNIDLNVFLLSSIDDMNDIESMELKDDGIVIVTHGNDPYYSIDLSLTDIKQFITTVQNNYLLIFRICLCLLLDTIILVCYRFRRHLLFIIKELFINRKLLYQLAKNDFKTRFSGSYLGVIWAFVQPVVTVIVYWFVFQMAFKSGDIEGAPFILWLVSGLVPWFFFAESINSATVSLIDYSYLVKKVVFNISILPVVKILSSLFVHLFFVGFVLLLFIISGYGVDVYMIQVIYYTVCMIILVMGIVYGTSAIQVFFRDMGQLVNIILQVGMWLTPIMWQDNMVDKYHWVLYFNPMYYITDGYRDSLIRKIWFWEKPVDLIIFWFITILLFVLGTGIFRKLKVHFADVL